MAAEAMPLKVALWCPDGRESLPLAARLFLEQLPRELVVWSSDMATPDHPGAGFGCDLWVVLCAGALPTPLPWKTSVGGVWAVLPGMARCWTARTVSTVNAWEPCHWLTDLLPDETGNPHLREAWGSGAVVWLPAWRSRPQPSASTSGLAVKSSARFEALLPFEPVRQLALAAAAQAVGGDRQERLLICSDDPVFSGAEVRAGAESGAEVLLLGVPGSTSRRQMLGGTPVCVLPLQTGTERIRPLFETLRTTLLRPPHTPVGTVPVLTLEDWAKAVIHPEHVPVDGGGIAARWKG